MNKNADLGRISMICYDINDISNYSIFFSYLTLISESQNYIHEINYHIFNIIIFLYTNERANIC